MAGDAEILTWPQDDVPGDLRTQVNALHDQAWPRDPGAPERRSAAGHDPALAPLSMLLVADGRVLAALDILSKELEHAGERYAASVTLSHWSLGNGSRGVPPTSTVPGRIAQPADS